jgi:nucleoside triphosphate pyrophosphatase
MLVLASASPRRQELLRNAGLEFTVCPADVPEIRVGGELPVDFAVRLAREKARAIFDKIKHGNSDCGGQLVLGADTVVIVDEHVLGKPRDEADAVRMLRMLSGRRHEVTTGVCLIGTDFEDARSETTEVTFDILSDADIKAYVSSGEPMDKAGAYAIQGIASGWIPRIDGCYFNVVGLPVALAYRMLREHAAKSK